MADIKISQMGQVTVSPTDLVPIVRDGVNYATPAGGLAVLAGSLTFTGDVTGSGTSPFAMTLANSGVTAGTYTKVTVDAKGRVTVGAALASGDLPTYTGTLTSGQVTTALGFTPASTASPAFSGTPTAPTATAGTNTTQLATTAFVVTALGSYAPLASPTFTGKVITAASASGGAGINVPHGTAPSSPVNGDFWSTTAGFYGRVNGVTVGPFSAGGGGSPITSSSAQAFAVGQNGNTNPAFNVDASTASSATGVSVKSRAAGAGVSITAISSSSDESLTINPKGTFGVLYLGSAASSGVQVGNPSGGGVTAYNLIATGVSSSQPFFLTQATLVGSPSGGGFEFGSDYCFYASTEANQRGVIDVKTLSIQQAGYTLTSTTSAQKAFNGSTNGAVTLAVGTYEFEALIVLTGMSATSGSFGFALGGTATFTQSWMSEANKVATLATAGAAQNALSTAANTTLATANTNTKGYAKITGTIVVTVAGTVIPQVSLGVAAAASVNAGSFFKVRKIGSTSVVTVGNWS